MGRGRARRARTPFAAAFLALLSIVASPAAAEPPELFWEGSATAIASDATHIYIAANGGSLETCGFDPTLTNPVLVRVSKANPNDVDVLVEACYESIGAMVTANGWLYYRNGAGKIEFLPTGGFALPVILVDENTGASGLATDGDHLYWITRSGTTSTIHRVELNSGTPEVVTTFDNEGNFPRGVEVDETYLYWAEGQIGAGAVRRMPKDGGPIVKLAGPGDGLDNTAALEIDESHVYFAGIADNRVRRVPKAGGAIFDYVSNWNSEVEIDGMPADDDRSVGSLLVHEDRLIWTDTTGGYDGRVRRIETSSSAVEDNEVTDLQILALAPRAAHVSGGSVYWAQNEQVYRTPIDSTGIAIDLSLTHMEVTQALQNVPANGEAGDVPLVEDKVTWIRLYPWIEAPDAPPGAYIHQNHVSARVRGYRDGVELPGSPLVPTSPELAVKPHAERRKHLDRTFNFFVPPSWRSGVVELEAEINPGGAIAETDYSNNVILGEITFETPRPLCLVFVPVKTPDGTPSVTDTTMDDIFANLKILWPTGRIHRGTVDSISEAGGPYEVEDDGGKILNKLEWLRFWAEYPSGWCEDFTGRTHWVGVLEPSETGYLGLARYDNNVSWIQKLSGQANFSIPTLLDFEEEFGTAIVPPSIPRSGSILAQELGHNYNRRHVDCGGPDDIDASYPYNTRYTYDETVEGHWGFDHRRMGSLLYEQWALIRKETLAADFMSYCAPGWVSDYTYRALLDASGGVSQDGGGAAVIVVPFAPTDQILTVGALVTPEHSHGEELGEPHAEITQIRLIHGDALSARKRIELARLAASLDAPKSPWTVDLVRDDDTLLVSYPFAPPESPGEHHGELSIIFPVRFENGAERILIRYHGDTLAEVEVSRNWPIVEVVSPNGGEELPQDLTIEWTSSDPDGDELTHDIQYSPDGGESWYVVAQNVVGTSYSLADPSSIPGSAGAALVRVVASDGVRSQADVSDAPFHLGFRAPRAFISRPRPGEVLAHGETIVLEGGATDPEELDLSENQLSWLVDGKAFGTGAELAIAGLGIGPHTAELRALDSNQKGSTARVDFWIGRRACPPSDQRMEIVWLIESSDLMEMHEREVCAKIAGTVSHLESMGLTVESTVATMLEGGRCADTSVPEIGDKGVVFTGLEWHEGVETIASRHEWTQGTRVIVPIVKQAPKSLSSYPSLIASAAKVANANGIHVAPWLVPLLDGPVNPNARSMAEAFAAATGGIVLEWDSPANPVEIFSLKLTGNCRPEVHGVEPTGPVDPNRPVVVFGEDLRPGVIVEIGGRPAREVEYGPDGSWIRFRLPFGLDLLEEHKLEVGRPGQRSVEAPQSIVVSTGDVTPPEIVCPQSRRVRCESDEGATVEFVVSATDAVDPSPTIVCEPPSGSLFPIGTTIVKCAATDASGNEATCIFEVTVLCTDDASFRRGDANADGRVDLSDALFSLGALFLGGSAHSCPDAGDTNDDNKIDITDPIAVLQFLFVGGAPPASPGHATCGLDPTEDALGPCIYACD